MIKKTCTFFILLLIALNVVVCSEKSKENVERVEGLFPIFVNDKWGYIDNTGKVVIESQFEGVHRFSGGLAVVEIQKKFGYIDKTGNIVIELKFDKAGDFSNGLAYVNIGAVWYEHYSGGKYGYIDKKR